MRPSTSSKSGRSQTSSLRVIEGEPGEQLVALSTTLDVLVVGSRRYGPLRSVLVGDVGTRLAMEARCALVIVPRGADGMVDP